MSTPDGLKQASPLLRRLPEVPLSDEILPVLREFAELADDRGPHVWFYVLCWAFYRELFDLLNDVERGEPIKPIASASDFAGKFSALARQAHKAIADGAEADLTGAANGIGKLI